MDRYKTLFSESFDDGVMEPHPIEAYNIVRGIIDGLEAEGYSVSASDGESDDTIFYLTVEKTPNSPPGGMLGRVRGVLDDRGVEILKVDNKGMAREFAIKIPYDIGHTGE